MGNIFKLAGIRKVPEGFQKLVRKLTLPSEFRCSSGRFRKVSGSLFGSLFVYFLYSCSSGRHRKVSGSLSGSLFEDVIFLHSGRFRKAPGGATGSGIKYQVMVLGLVSDASWQLSMAFLNLHGVSEGRVSIACLLISPCGSCFLYHARSCKKKKNSSTFRKLPEACRKVSGSLHSICSQRLLCLFDGCIIANI